MSVEAFIKDYLNSAQALYEDGCTFEDIAIKGSEITFTEVSPCGYYKEHTCIDLLDVLIWVYTKSNNK